MNFILFLVICLIVFVIFYMRRKRVEKISDAGFVQKSTLSKRECKELIEIAKNMISKQNPMRLTVNPNTRLMF